MSTFIEQVLSSRGHEPSDVATLGGRKTVELVYSVLTLAIRGAGMEVVASPNDETPIGYAHASVVRPPALSKSDWRTLRSDFSVLMNCVYGQPSPPPPS